MKRAAGAVVLAFLVGCSSPGGSGSGGGAAGGSAGGTGGGSAGGTGGGSAGGTGGGSAGGTGGGSAGGTGGGAAGGSGGGSAGGTGGGSGGGVGGGSAGGAGGGAAMVRALNDTGIKPTQCFEVGSNSLVLCTSANAMALNTAQDGVVGRDSSPATNSNADGTLGFSFASVAGGCVTDNVTGLMWENKANDGGIRDRTKLFTNYRPVDPGYGGPGDAIAFVNAVNASNLCGFNDWRLPKVDELQSLLNHGVVTGAGPAIDETWFPLSQSSKFWTGSNDAASAGAAWGVDFDFATTLSLSRTFQAYVRAVRSGPSPLPTRYAFSASGAEVTDLQTGLVWRRCAEGQAWSGTTCTGTPMLMPHEAAMQHAMGQAADAGSAWRVPNIKELASIADKTMANPAIDISVFPPPVPSGGLFWSSTPTTGTSPIMALHVNFGSGAAGYGMVSPFLRISDAHLRLVRNAP